MIRGYSARDPGPGSAALEPSSSEPKAVPWSVTDAPGCSRVCRVTARSQPSPGPTRTANDRLVPKRRRRWSGAPTHQSGTAVPGAATHRPGAEPADGPPPPSEDVVPADVHRAVEAERVAAPGRPRGGPTSGPVDRPVIASSSSRLPPPEPMTPWPLQPPLSHRPSTASAPTNGRWSGVYSYWPAWRIQLTPRSQTSAQNGATWATLSGDAGSRSRKAKSADVGTLQAGSVGRRARLGEQDVGAAEGRPPVRAGRLVDRHRGVLRHLRGVGHDHLLTAGRGDRDVDAGEGRRPAEERARREDDERCRDRAVVRLDRDDPAADGPQAGHPLAERERRLGRPGRPLDARPAGRRERVAPGQADLVDEPVAGPEPGLRRPCPRRTGSAAGPRRRRAARRRRGRTPRWRVDELALPRRPRPRRGRRRDSPGGAGPRS